MKIRILHKGDSVLNVTKDSENIITIGFGDNIVETESENGVTILNF